MEPQRPEENIDPKLASRLRKRMADLDRMSAKFAEEENVPIDEAYAALAALAEEARKQRATQTSPTVLLPKALLDVMNGRLGGFLRNFVERTLPRELPLLDPAVRMVLAAGGMDPRRRSRREALAFGSPEGETSQVVPLVRAAVEVTARVVVPWLRATLVDSSDQAPPDDIARTLHTYLLSQAEQISEVSRACGVTGYEDFTRFFAETLATDEGLVRQLWAASREVSG